MDVERKLKNNVSKKVLKPFIAPGSDVPVTQEEIEKRKRRMERAENLGQSLTKITFEKDGIEEYENPYRVKALEYIMADKEVPEELKDKIVEFEKEYKKAIRKQVK